MIAAAFVTPSCRRLYATPDYAAGDAVIATFTGDVFISPL